MNPGLSVFASSAVAVGFVHTAIGIDHYLPFVVLGRAQGWSLKKVLGIALLCGIGHVLSSVCLGLLGVALGMTLQKWEIIHRVQGSLAAWFLIIFGLTYAAWAFARRRRLQRHMHEHEGGRAHAHFPSGSRSPEGDHDKASVVTAWTLFIIFVLGPCEPLIPLMIVPALRSGLGDAMGVAAVFSFTTILSMLGLVAIGHYGLTMVPLRRLEAHANTLAGLAVAASGIAIRLFGI